MCFTRSINVARADNSLGQKYVQQTYKYIKSMEGLMLVSINGTSS